MTEKSEALVEPKDAGKGPEGVVKRWLMEWHQAGEREKEWRPRATEVMKTYRGDKSGSNRFNILWSNTEILRPAVYNSTPRPDVRRRNRDADPTGKQVAEVLERSLAFCMDSYDFDHVINMAVLDDLLPGRGVTRVRYEPKFSKTTDEQGQPYEAMAYAETYCEPVVWDCFRHGPGRTWGEVTWEGFEHRMTMSEFKKKWSKFADKVTLDYDLVPEGDDKSKKNNPEVFKRVVVLEIWDKDNREVLFIAPSYKEGPLQVQKDPLGLQGFFCTPRPLMALDSTDTLVPVEEYRLYKDQADELDRVTRRINKLVNGLKLRGIYDSTLKEMADVMSADDNALVPAVDSYLAMQMGGFEKAIWMLPIEPAAKVLMQLYQQREQLKQVIYEITGISDVLRGSTDPNETLGAQQLKAQNGSMRIQRRQREVQRYIRDLLRMKAEIIAEKYTPQILQLMTGIAVTPDMQAIMKQDLLRAFRVDIETDSTIAGDQNADRQMVTEMIEGIGKFVQSVGPAVESGGFSQETAKKLLLASVRRFKFGREVEDAIEQDEQQPQTPAAAQPDPMEGERMKVAAETQAKQQELALRAEEKKAEMQDKREERMINAQFKAKELMLKEEELGIKKMEMQHRITSEQARGEIEAETARTNNEVAMAPVKERQQDMVSLTQGLEMLAQAILQGQQQMQVVMVEVQQANAENMQQMMKIMASPKKAMKNPKTGEITMQHVMEQ